MEAVGVRELKNRLGYYLRAVRQGRAFVVTDRGKPIARLVPAMLSGEGMWSPDLERRMWELAAEGILVWTGEPARIPEPVGVNRGQELLSDLVVEGRG
ncbi:MAG: type II toxin-antitoxin system Phd/YefM family antitoxin [Anaerolineae bacterium]|jgi:prevent-host-death family protein